MVSPQLYTTVVSCRSSFRFLLVFRRQSDLEIVFKLDVGNLQVKGSLLRIFNRSNMRGYLRNRESVDAERKRRADLVNKLAEWGGLGTTQVWAGM